VLLHFGAVDDEATVWVNGREAYRHRGGWTPFTLDLHGVAEPGQTATIVVRARDDHRKPKPRGKQSAEYANHDCDYTRTTGIWQTVWMEPVPHAYLKRARISPDLGNRALRIEQPIFGNAGRMSVRATLRNGAGDDVIVQATSPAGHGLAAMLDLRIPEGHVHVWSPKDPYLYALTLELLDPAGKVVDSVQSYAGLRSVSIDGKAIKINGETVFQRLVLDQGYYADGVLTAPDDAALARDIELSIAAGFNGARLHQKVFEERFLYHADRLGYLCWGEIGDWGMWGDDNPHYNQPGANIVAQWLEAIERDYSHPSIVGWCPLNETRQNVEARCTALDDVTRALFLATKALDQTRPVLDASGYAHRVSETDVYDSHNYEQDPQKFAEQMRGTSEDKPFVNLHHDRPMSLAYRGQPYFCSEFGGTWWSDDAAHSRESWGYGQNPKSRDEAQRRIEGLMKVLLDDPSMFGYCYTQLTDVFQEQNGLYTFDRRPKFDMDRLRKLQQSPAAIERAK
jgi:beta-galactosidase/beta-glucuronidase